MTFTMQVIDSYLRNVPPGYALLLSGPWGAGKSFFWTRYASQLEGLHAVTISAAGLQTSADLEDALLTASLAPLANSVIGEAGAIIGKALLRVVKVDPKDIKLKADIFPGKSVVCIDDVERFAGAFPALFGFIVNLLDGSGVHCILIADEDRALANLEGYAAYKERIVGKTVVVSPTIREFCDQVVKGFGTAQSRRVLDGGMEVLVNLIVGAKLANLRTVRFLLTELEAVVREMPAATAERVMSSSLPSAMLFWAVAIARSPSNMQLLVRAFQGDIGMAISMARRNQSEDTRRDTRDEDDDIKRLSDLLYGLGLEDAAYNWPNSKAFIALAKGEVFDPNALIADFGLLDTEECEVDDLDLLRHHYKQNDTDVQQAITRLRAAAIDGKPAVLAHLFQVFRTVYYLAENHITTFTPQEWTQEVLGTLARWRENPEQVDSGEFEVWPSAYSPDEQTVIKLAEEVSEAVKNVEQGRHRQAAVNGLLTGKGSPSQDRLQVVFADDTDVDWFFSQLKTAGSPAIQRVYSLFSSHLRVVNAVQFVAVEAHFARELADKIETHIEKRRPMPVLDSELHILARLLRTFADKMDKDSAALRSHA